MNDFFYETPTLERKQDVLDYIDEVYRCNSNLDGTGSLSYIQVYEEWLLDLEKRRKTTNNTLCPPEETYLFIRKRDNKIIGITNIRFFSNCDTAFKGHIGYNIRPTEQRKGYNKINLYKALEVCEEKGIETICLVCMKDNIASSKSMISLGAELDDEYGFEDNPLQIYKINVSKSIKTFKELNYNTETKGIQYDKRRND